MLLLGLLLMSLAFIGVTVALARTTEEVLSPERPTERTIKLLRALKKQFGRRYSYVWSLLPYIQAAAQKYRVDPALILAIMAQESRGNPMAVSNTGAIGLMQIMPQTAKRICGYSSLELLDPIKNIDCGTRILAYLRGRVETLKDVIASYYAGEKAYLYRKRYGRYPSYGKPPVYKYVSDVWRRYIFLVRAVA